MKQVILIGLLTLPLALKAQKTLTEYQASNGITYHIGDTVKLGRGSGASHEFLYVLTSSGASAQRGYSGGKLVIKKIHRVNFRGMDKVYFVTAPKYLLYIEDAIETCEVPCK